MKPQLSVVSDEQSSVISNQSSVKECRFTDDPLRRSASEASCRLTTDPLRRSASEASDFLPRQLPPMLALWSRVVVGWRPGRVVARARDNPMHYDVRYDDGGLEVSIDGPRVKPEDGVMPDA